MPFLSVGKKKKVFAMIDSQTIVSSRLTTKQWLNQSARFVFILVWKFNWWQESSELDWPISFVKKNHSAKQHGLGSRLAPVRAGGRDRLGPDRDQPAAAASRGPVEAVEARRRPTDRQHLRPQVRDLAEHARKVSGHAAGVQRKRLFLRRGKIHLSYLFFRSPFNC